MRAQLDHHLTPRKIMQFPIYFFFPKSSSLVRSFDRFDKNGEFCLQKQVNELHTKNQIRVYTKELI